MLIWDKLKHTFSYFVFQLTHFDLELKQRSMCCIDFAHRKRAMKIKWNIRSEAKTHTLYCSKCLSHAYHVVTADACLSIRMWWPAHTLACAAQLYCIRVSTSLRSVSFSSILFPFLDSSSFQQLNGTPLPACNSCDVKWESSERVFVYAKEGGLFPFHIYQKCIYLSWRLTLSIHRCVQMSQSWFFCPFKYVI